MTCATTRTDQKSNLTTSKSINDLITKILSRFIACPFLLRFRHEKIIYFHFTTTFDYPLY